MKRSARSRSPSRSRSRRSPSPSSARRRRVGSPLRGVYVPAQSAALTTVEIATSLCMKVAGTSQLIPDEYVYAWATTPSADGQTPAHRMLSTLADGATAIIAASIDVPEARHREPTQLYVEFTIAGLEYADDPLDWILQRVGTMLLREWALMGGRPSLGDVHAMPVLYNLGVTVTHNGRVILNTKVASPTPTALLAAGANPTNFPWLRG